MFQVLDPSEESSLWSSPYGEVNEQWIAFDLGRDCPVGALRLLAMSNTTCPKLASRCDDTQGAHTVCHKKKKNLRPYLCFLPPPIKP